MARGPRTRVRPGIYADAYGLSATVKVGHIQRERRFKRTEDEEADLRAAERWQLRTRADLLGDQPVRRPPAAETLAAAVPGFLATIANSSARRDYEKLLATWIASPLGAMPRHEIRRHMVLAQLAQWERDGYSPGTRNHRVRALRKLYDVLDFDDETAINPCAKIPRFTEPEPEERGASYALIEAVLACVSDLGFTPARGTTRPEASKAKARLAVMAWTGLPPALIRKLTPGHVHAALATGELEVTPRRKGKGVKARRLPLLPEAIDALRAFDQADAYGAYSNAGPWNAWQRARARYLRQLRDARTPPAALAEIARILNGPLKRPYDLRHSFAASVYEASGSRDAVRDLLMHGSIQTSDRYVTRGVYPASKTALAAVAAARAAQQHGPVLVPAGAIRPTPRITDRPNKSPKRLQARDRERSAKARKFPKKTAV